jgi:zinc protease
MAASTKALSQLRQDEGKFTRHPSQRAYIAAMCPTSEGLRPMKSLVPLVLTLGALMSSIPAFAETQTPAETANEIPRMAPNAVEFQLDNGMQVVVIPDHRAPVVTHMVWYKVGAADETTGQSGIAHFLEHLMFKGTTEHPDDAFRNRVAAIGGDENAFTSSDYTAFFQRVAKENLGEMMEFEADRMVNLVLTDEVVATERDVVLNERRDRVERNPNAILHEALLRILYLNHPYGRPIIGWKHEIKELDRQTALDFYRRYYTPSNAILVVAGDVTPDKVRQLAEATYGQIATRPDAKRAPRPAEPPEVGPRTVTVSDEKVTEPQLQRAYVVPSAVTAEPGEAEALTLLAEILGGGATSRFYDQLVRGDGAATYAAANYRANGLDSSLFTIFGLPKPGLSLHDLEAHMDGVIQDLLQNGITDEELERAKRSAIAQAIYSLDSQVRLANIIAQALAVGQKLEDVQTWPARINAVTAEDVLAAAQKYLRPEASATGYLEPSSPEQS